MTSLYPIFLYHRKVFPVHHHTLQLIQKAKWVKKNSKALWQGCDRNHFFYTHRNRLQVNMGTFNMNLFFCKTVTVWWNWAFTVGDLQSDNACIPYSDSTTKSIPASFEIHSSCQTRQAFHIFPFTFLFFWLLIKALHTRPLTEMFSCSPCCVITLCSLLTLSLPHVTN